MRSTRTGRATWPRKQCARTNLTHACFCGGAYNVRNRNFGCMAGTGQWAAILSSNDGNFSSIIVWSLLVGPVIGAAVYLFVRLTEAARDVPIEIGARCVVLSSLSNHRSDRDSISTTLREWKGNGAVRI